jgi:molybdopterin-guanine dinucleotide biosynthesis protein A
MIHAVLLAGGQSQRMGQDKAMLTLGKQSLLSRNYALLKRVVNGQVWVSGDYQGFACIPDETIGLGPIGGIQSVCAALKHDGDGLLFLPVDMPLIQEEPLTLLCELFAQSPQNYYFQQSVFPMILRNGVADDAGLTERIEQRCLSILGFLEGASATALPILNAWQLMFTNTNTPTQWSLAQQLIEE